MDTLEHCRIFDSFVVHFSAVLHRRPHGHSRVKLDFRNSLALVVGASTLQHTNTRADTGSIVSLSNRSRIGAVRILSSKRELSAFTHGLKGRVPSIRRSASVTCRNLYLEEIPLLLMPPFLTPSTFRSC